MSDNTTKSIAQDDMDGLKVLFEPLRPTGVIHMIAPAHSPYKVLDVTDISPLNGAKVQLWDNKRYTNQSFRPEYVGGGAFRFVAEHSGKVLDVANGESANGTPITQWDWHGGNNQRFFVNNPRRTTKHWIVPVHSLSGGKVLDVAGASQANGAKIQLWDKDVNGRRNQLFSFLPKWLIYSPV
jgi:hypothetical protein